MAQVKRWCFTLNNYDQTPNFYKELFTRQEYQPVIVRAIWGYEIAPTTNTRHLQGYIEMSRSYRLLFMKSILPNAHYIAAKGTAKQNYDYCKKDGNYETIGDWNFLVTGDYHTISASPGMIVYGLLQPKFALKVKLK